LVKGKKIKRAVLSDHIKNFDWKVRKAKFIEKAAAEVLVECLGKISALILFVDKLQKSKFEMTVSNPSFALP
jgi:hypothetical protein